MTPSTFLSSSGRREVTNIPYFPELNGIEKLCALMKYRFRKRLTRIKMQYEKVDVEEEIK